MMPLSPSYEYPGQPEPSEEGQQSEARRPSTGLLKEYAPKLGLFIVALVASGKVAAVFDSQQEYDSLRLTSLKNAIDARLVDNMETRPGPSAEITSTALARFSADTGLKVRLAPFDGYVVEVGAIATVEKYSSAEARRSLDEQLDVDIRYPSTQMAEDGKIYANEWGVVFNKIGNMIAGGKRFDETAKPTFRQSLETLSSELARADSVKTLVPQADRF